MKTEDVFNLKDMFKINVTKVTHSFDILVRINLKKHDLKIEALNYTAEGLRAVVKDLKEGSGQEYELLITPIAKKG